MSQRGYRPSAMLLGFGFVHRTSKHSARGNKAHRALVMESFSRAVLARTPHPLTIAREEATKRGMSDSWAKRKVREARK